MPGSCDVDCTRHHGRVRGTLRTGGRSQHGHGPHHSLTYGKSNSDSRNSPGLALLAVVAMVRGMTAFLSVGDFLVAVVPPTRLAAANSFLLGTGTRFLRIRRAPPNG